MMDINAGDLVKIVTGFGSLGGGFAFFKPFAEKIFTFWLDRLKARAAIKDANDSAIMRNAVATERLVGVLESVEQRIDTLNMRQERLERHMGIPMSSAGIQAVRAPVEHASRLRTDPSLQQTLVPIK